MMISDLEGFEPEWIDPVSTNYRGYDVWNYLKWTRNCSIANFKNLENFDIREMSLIQQNTYMFLQKQKN